jgi:hypothetical protein
MKTPEDWKSLITSTEGLNITSINQLIQQIQLEAFKDGMTKASEICRTQDNTKHIHGFASQYVCEDAILIVRDNMKELPQ